LLDPAFPFDPPLEFEHLADAIDLATRPIRDLLVARDAHRVKTLLDQDPDTADALQIVVGA